MTSPVRRRAARYPRELAFETGPWVGVRNLTDPTSARNNLLSRLQNCYIESPELNSAVVSRPGFTRAAASGQLGSSGFRRTQGVIEFTKLDGTVYRVVVCGGSFYTYSWGTNTFTIQSLGAYSLDADARVYLVPFADKLVISDGVNTPLIWDGSAFAELTNCPVLYGSPWVYYAKLFGIKDAERSTIVWSEENDPTTGYEVGGYNNAWTLGQTAQDPLYAGVGLNDQMLVFRARSTTQIIGAVNADFQSTGTREGISETIGTTSPDSIVVVGRSVYWLDADARPQRYIVGQGMQNEPAVWENARVDISEVALTALASVRGGYHPTIDVVLLAVPASGLSDPSYILTFDGSSGRYSGIWTGFPMTAMGFWTDTTNAVVMVHGSTDGIPYIHGVPGGTQYDDELDAGTAAIAHFVEGPTLGHSVTVEKFFDRIDASLRVATAMTDVRVRLSTSQGLGNEQVMVASGGVSLWDTAVWDTDVWSAEAAEQHPSVGSIDHGRWCKVQISHEVTGEYFGLTRLAVHAFAEGDFPEAL